MLLVRITTRDKLGEITERGALQRYGPAAAGHLLEVRHERREEFQQQGVRERLDCVGRSGITWFHPMKISSHFMKLL